MSREYKQVLSCDLKKYGLEEHECYDKWTSYIIYTDDGEKYEYVGDDNTEPEDATLGRSFGWVHGALEDAYVAGWKGGNDYAFPPQCTDKQETK